MECPWCEMRFVTKYVPGYDDGARLVDDHPPIRLGLRTPLTGGAGRQAVSLD